MKKKRTRKTPRAAEPTPPDTTTPPGEDNPATGQETPPAAVPATNPEPPPAVAGKEPEPVDAGELVKPLVEGMPEPTDSPLAADPTGKTPDPSKPQIGQVDTAGTVFDAEKHMADETGRPKTDVHGRFYSKHVGRKKGGPGNPKPPREPKIPGPDDVPEFNKGPEQPPVSGLPSMPRGPDRFDHAAELYCRTFYGTATAAFADDGWQPDNEAEHVGLKTSVAAYLRAKNSDDLPPGLVLAMAVSAYSGKRLTRPKTKDRLLFLWGIVKRKLKIKSAPKPETDKGDEIP